MQDLEDDTSSIGVGSTDDSSVDATSTDRPSSSASTTDHADDDLGQDEALVTADGTQDIISSLQDIFVSEDRDEKLELARAFKCSCKRVDGAPCSTRFTTEDMDKY